MTIAKDPKWTIMVYLAGDNDLPTYCISILQQLEAVKYPDDVCVLACFDSSVPWSAGLRYFRINCQHRQGHHQIDWEIHNDLVVPKKRREAIVNADVGKFDGSTSDKIFRPVVSEGLRRFIDWSVKQHPDSERYMLILFGHGLAINGQNFLISENPRSFLRVQDLQEIIGERFGANKRADGSSRQLDILALQNCVMNGIEMACALKDNTELMIGSQDLVLASGWPYQPLINSIVEDTSAPTPQVARKLLKACARHMLDFAIMDRSSDQSVIDLNALRDSSFVKAVGNLVEALVAGLEFQVINEKRELAYPAICDATRLARLEAQAFWKENYVDLFDFCERLLKRCNEVVKAQSKLLKQLGLEEDPQPSLRKSPLLATAKKIIDCCRAILEKENELVPHSYQIGPDLQYSRGVSIYFPWTLPGAPYVPVPMRGGRKFALKTTFDVYREYDFVKDSKWAEFLKSFFMATLRNIRRNSRKFHDLADSESLELGLVGETYGHHNEVKTGDLARTSPDTARTSPDTGDYDNSVYIKNYPRRNYLSPADWPRRKVDANSFIAGTKDFPNPDSPPVSALGWNVVGLVAEVLDKKPTNGNGHRNGGPKPVGEVDKDERRQMEPARSAEPADAAERVGP